MGRKFKVRPKSAIKSSISATPWKDRLWNIVDGDPQYKEEVFNEMFARLSDRDAEEICYALGVDPEDFEED